MTARDIIEVLGPKQRAAVTALRKLDVSVPRIVQVLRDLDLDEDHIGRLVGA